MADGQIIAALVTAVASGGAAFLGVIAANRNTKVVDVAPSTPPSGTTYTG